MDLKLFKIDLLLIILEFSKFECYYEYNWLQDNYLWGVNYKELNYSIPEKTTTYKYRPNAGWKDAKIDYLLVTKELTVKKAFSLADEVVKFEMGCPNELCPSDHIFIQADLELN